MDLKRSSYIKNLVLTGLFIAIGIVLPIAFHLFGGLGPKLLPMQFPVLLAGYFLNPIYALAVGVLSPVLSGVMTGMPPFFPNMPCLIVEFGTYALALSLLKINNKFVKLLIALVLGKAVLLAVSFLNPSMFAFAVKQLSNGVIGMVWQIVLVPIVVKGCESGGYYVRHKTSKS